MKRSKMFLGMTTCLLAVVAVAATKAHKFFTTTHNGFYRPTATSACIADNAKAWYTFGSPGVDVAKTTANEVVVYTKSTCVSHTLFSTVAPGNE
jgi:hypothetical protein